MIARTIFVLIMFFYNGVLCQEQECFSLVFQLIKNHERNLEKKTNQNQ
jgi:hypothetical protein